MKKTIQALKVTTGDGRTCYGPRPRRALKVGMTIRPVRNQRLPRGADLAPWECSGRVVHAYAFLRQAQAHDRAHCRHGPRGIVWLVTITDPHHLEGKIVGRSYTVQRRLGPLGASITSKRCRALNLVHAYRAGRALGLAK